MQLRKLTASLLAFFILFYSLPFFAAAEEAEENEIYQIWSRDRDITPDIHITESVFNNGSPQAEHYICFTPGRTARPYLAYGDTIREKLEFPAAAELVEDRILAGINGDYFVMATGMPLGIVLHEGELISSDAGNTAFGFYEDGSAILGLPGLSMELSAEGARCAIGGINKNHKSGQFSLYTAAWGETVPLNEDYYCLELIPEDGKKLTIGGEIPCVCGRVNKPDGALPLEEGKLLLCYSGPEETWLASGLEQVEPGATLTLHIQASDERFSDCTEALGCLYPLLADGAILPGLDDIDKNKAPRTAIGIREDGTVILYTADGRQSGYAIGLTLAEVAMRLLELGCVEAGALDGGASTILACQYPGEDTWSLRNSPSLGKYRETPQFLLLTAAREEPGELASLAVYCDEKVMLSGSSCVFRCGGCDRNGAPLVLPDVRWKSDSGSMDDGGVFTAPESAGEVSVSALCGDTYGELRMPVIAQPDEITIFTEENSREVKQLRLLPGTEIDLGAKAYWNGIKVCASDELFDWSLEGEIGSIDDSGHFAAASRAAAGYLSISCGEVSCRIQVLVTDTVICIEDYEKMEAGNAPGLAWTAETNRDRVKYGLGSLRLDYDLSEGSVTLPMEEYPTELGSHAGLWVLSDGSGNNVYSVHDEITLLLGKLDHPGWVLFTVDTETFGRIKALRIGGSGSGTLWLDQLMSYSMPEPDLEAPVVRLSVSDDRIDAEIWDQTEGILSPELIQLTVNGEELSFDYDDSSGHAASVLPQTDLSARVILTARDRSGNYNSASILLDNGDVSSFPDMEGHWAKSYVDHLHGLGVVSGRLAEDDTIYYDPDSRITRAEFAVMLCRWLRIDLSEFGSEILFADEDTIPSWAADSVKAAAALGLIQGAAEPDGLYFMPQQLLTRAQAAVILGRTMPGGRMLSDLPWPDAGDIPLWARSYVSELAFMGVMTGNGIDFEPNAALTRAQAAKLLSELT